LQANNLARQQTFTMMASYGSNTTDITSLAVAGE
jgi:hypothetical protein